VLEMTAMLTWQGVDVPRLEGARVVLGERGMRANGAVVSSAAADAPAYSANYALAAAETGVVSRVSVRVVSASGERQVLLNRSEEGIWLVDHGKGAERTDFEGALDVDVSACVLFNAIPVRRLALHRQADEHELPVVYVELPDLQVRLVRQTYRGRPTSGGPAIVQFRQDEFNADLIVDADGLVLDYPGLAYRL
jgi:hypothetical protein